MELHERRLPWYILISFLVFYLTILSNTSCEIAHQDKETDIVSSGWWTSNEFLWGYSEVYSEPLQTSKKERFYKTN